MTFYSVISGILFMGACQALFAALGTDLVAYAALLVLIMCNESVITSEVLEADKHPSYSLSMKLLDLSTFFVLAYALVVLSPTSNAFGSRLDLYLPGIGSPAAFYLLFAAYAALSLLWSHAAGRLKTSDSADTFYCLRFAPILFGGVFLTCGLASWNSHPFPTPDVSWPAWVLNGMVIVYFIVRLPFVKKVM